MYVIYTLLARLASSKANLFTKSSPLNFHFVKMMQITALLHAAISTLYKVALNNTGSISRNTSFASKEGTKGEWRMTSPFAQSTGKMSKSQDIWAQNP